MAVFYKWIKGCTEESTLTTGSWSYIKWTNGLPELYVSNSGKQDSLGSGVKNYGKLLSTNVGADVVVNDNWTFNGNYIKVNQANLDKIIPATLDGTISVEAQMSFAKGVTFTSTSEFNDKATFNKAVDFKNLIKMNADAKIESSASITARYFVATSDVRAKDSVELWNYTALDLVNATPVYSFNYKSDHDRVVSILAQDLLENQPENLDLVNDKDADGINKFMSIKSDKLTFVLWKAVQELSDKVDRLERELEEIKHSK